MSDYPVPTTVQQSQDNVLMVLGEKVMNEKTSQGLWLPLGEIKDGAPLWFGRLGWKPSKAYKDGNLMGGLPLDISPQALSTLSS